MKPITVNYGKLVLLFGLVCGVTAYTKFGRTCKDIGCLPSEICTMAYETCSYSQRDGKECGSYPTCSKTGADFPSRNPGASLNPAPENTRISSSNNPSQNQPQPVDPNYIFGRPNQNTNPINPNYKGFPQYPPPQPSQPKGPPNYPNYPIFGNPNPYQPTNPYIFGNPPMGAGHHGQVPGQYPPFNHNFGQTTKKPSLLDQFLYNKQPHKRNRNGSSTLAVGLASIILCLNGHLIYRWLTS